MAAGHDVQHLVDRFSGDPWAAAGLAHFRPVTALILRPKPVQHESVGPYSAALLIGIPPAISLAAAVAPATISTAAVAAAISAILAVGAIIAAAAIPAILAIGAVRAATAAAIAPALPAAKGRRPAEGQHVIIEIAGHATPAWP